MFALVSRAERELAQWMGAHATSIKAETALRLAMLRRFFSYGNLALAGSLSTALALHVVPARAPRDAAPTVEPARTTVEDHWQRATGIISAALASFQRVRTLQTAAARQIDAAEYALSQLLQDLRPAMGLPADVAGLRAVLAEAERTAPQRHRKALAA